MNVISCSSGVEIVRSIAQLEGMLVNVTNVLACIQVCSWAKVATMQGSICCFARHSWGIDYS